MPGWISSGSVSRSERTEHFPDSVPAQLRPDAVVLHIYSLTFQPVQGYFQGNDDGFRPLFPLPVWGEGRVRGSDVTQSRRQAGSL